MISKSKEKRSEDLEGLGPIHSRVAGIDLGSTTHYVGISLSIVRPGEEAVRTFSAMTHGLEEMIDWLLSYGIESVAMEATGVYWLGAYEALESRGIEVWLVNARHLKNVSGRKSDVQDCQWLQQLHTYGLLRKSFVPDELQRELREYVRLRSKLEGEKSQALLHMHKSLDLMNLKIHKCIKNMDSKSGMGILRAIVEGEYRAEELVKLVHRQVKVERSILEASLRGNYKAQHVFALKQALVRYEFYSDQMLECELEIERVLMQLADLAAPEEAPLALPPQRPAHKVKKNGYQVELKPSLDRLLKVDLTQIDGLAEATVVDLISEIGVDMSSWPSARHFTSWLRLAPQNKISGGKLLGHYRAKGANRASQTFRIAAYAVANSKSALGAFYRRLRARKGPQIAIKATARKIAVIYYHMMTKKEAFRPQSQTEYQAALQERQLRKLENQARKLGFQLTKKHIEQTLNFK